MRKLVLVDAFAVIYRSFYAIRTLSTSEGEPTNAVFGFIRKMIGLRQKSAASHLAVVFDGGLPERRLNLLPDYKSQRPPMPDAMRSQLGYIDEYLCAASIAVLRVDGEEADDVIASVVERFGRDFEAIEVESNDKDLFQIVTERVRIALPSGKGLMGPEDVKKKTGVPPALIVDWLALIGDSSDNIDGVPGVGAKTAAKLLSRFGGIDALREGLSALPEGRVKRMLEQNWPIVERNRELVRLRRDIRLDISADALMLNDPDPDRLLRLFDRLQFHRLADDIRNPKLL